MMPRKIPSYILIGAIFSILSLSMLYSNLVIFSLEFYKPRVPYWDLNSDINPLWDCFQTSGLKLFLLDLNTFPSLDGCRNFTYGYFSIASFGLFHFISSNATFWGIVQIIAFNLFIAGFYFQKIRKNKLILSLLALFSPGVFLLLASGNMDIQIIILLLLASHLLQRGNEKLALMLVCITALFKYYTSPILFILYFLVRNKSSKLFGVFLMFATAALILFQMVYTPIPPFPAGAQNKFGISIFSNYARKAGVEISQLQGGALGMLLLVTALAIIYLFYYRTKSKTFFLDVNFPVKDEMSYWSFIILAGTSFVCYVTALNADYRLTFFALAGISLIQIPQVQIKFVTRLFPFIWLASLWFSFPSAYFSQYIGLDLQPLGDIAMVGTMSYLIFQSFFVFKLLRRKVVLQDSRFL